MIFSRKKKTIAEPKEERFPEINPAVEKYYEAAKNLDFETMNENLDNALIELGIECPWGDWDDFEAFDTFMSSGQPLIFQ